MAVDYEVLELQLEGTAQMLSEARREITKLRAENERLRTLEHRVYDWAAEGCDGGGPAANALIDLITPDGA